MHHYQSNYPIQAVVLDLDGVITKTAKVHRKAWKQMFDKFLGKHSDKQDLFTNNDYTNYVDGKPRYEGVKSFLQSRNIDLPFGKPEDKPGDETMSGLGNRKNELFLELIKEKGVEIYPNAIRQIKDWREHGIRTAVVSSSKNCKFVLENAGISDLFDVCVDGITAQKLSLKGKPEPEVEIRMYCMIMAPIG